jgi:hypothetical protein
MRRTKATLIYRRTKNLRAVQLLLRLSKLESTVRFLGIEVDGALEIAERTAIRGALQWPLLARCLGRSIQRSCVKSVGISAFGRCTEPLARWSLVGGCWLLVDGDGSRADVVRRGNRPQSRQVHHHERTPSNGLTFAPAHARVHVLAQTRAEVAKRLHPSRVPVHCLP